MTSGTAATPANSTLSAVNALKSEKILIGALLVAILGYGIEHTLVDSGNVIAGIATLALIAVIIGVAMRVAHHAEVLAEKLGEPYGTMILTTAAVLVEVVILAVMMNNAPSPTLARDVVVSAVLLDTCGILGLAALVGGFMNGEQVYNDNTGRSYVVMIMASIGISMVIPNFVGDAHWKAYSIFTIISMVVLYALFLRMQTKEHSYFFSYNYEKSKKRQEKVEQHLEPEVESTKLSVVMLVAGIVITGLIAEIMSKTMSVSIAGTGIPPIFPAIVVAVISASPEILTAMRSAMNNRFQQCANVCFGASLATVILTVPVIEAIALFKGQDVNMSLSPLQMAMMGITLVVSALNVSDGESNAIEGGVHLMLFATFIFLSCIGL